MILDSLKVISEKPQVNQVVPYTGSWCDLRIVISGNLAPSRIFSQHLNDTEN